MKIYSFPILIFLFVPSFSHTSFKPSSNTFYNEVVQTLKSEILKEAAWALTQQPETITSQSSPRSSGGKHDFYSEGDYWWPDLSDPDGPYIQKDGMTNPGNFVAHRLAMIRFSKIIGALASAYKITRDEKYVSHALVHFKAWFINPNTLMNPNLRFAQAIKGRHTGRGIGIIDTIHLMEVAQGLIVMRDSKTMDLITFSKIQDWFSEYLNWLTTHQYGKDEMNAKNNHGTCWVMQVASFARLTGDEKLIDFCRERYKKVLLPNQMAGDGSFPLELSRTKPYGYSLFNLDAMAMICQILSDEKESLWEYTNEGKNFYKAMDFIYPYIEDKSKWPFPKDVMYWENWPVAHPSLLFAAEAFNNKEWFNTWKMLNHSPEEAEVIRNLPVRNPVLWF